MSHRKRQLTEDKYQINRQKKEDSVKSYSGVRLYGFFSALSRLNLKEGEMISATDNYVYSLEPNSHFYKDGKWQEVDEKISGNYATIDVLDANRNWKSRQYIERSTLWVKK